MLHKLVYCVPSWCIVYQVGVLYARYTCFGQIGAGYRRQIRLLFEMFIKYIHWCTIYISHAYVFLYIHVYIQYTYIGILVYLCNIRFLWYPRANTQPPQPPLCHTHTHKHTHDIPIGEFHASHPILKVIFIKAHELKPALRPVPANMYMYTLYM